MKVFKATGPDMTCHLGDGIFQYVLGVPSRADKSKCGGTGLHACENVADCIRYYDLGCGNRFFEAEAAGNFSEDGQNTRIACTKLTLIRELTTCDIAREIIFYMRDHPRRENWKFRRHRIDVDSESAEMAIKGGIAIARGKNPKVRGCEGAILGLVKEDDNGIIREGNSRLFTVAGHIRPGVWYTLESADEILAKEATT